MNNVTTEEIKAKLASTNKVPASEIGEIEYTETEIQEEQ